MPPFAERLFNASILFGIMLLIALSAEMVANYFLPKRIDVGPLIRMVGLVLGISLLGFGLGRLAVNVQESGWEQTASNVGRVVTLVLAGGLVLLAALGYLRRNIALSRLIGSVVGFFAAGIIANLTLRQLVAPDVLTDDDMLFISVVVALALVSVGNLVLRPYFQERSPPARSAASPVVDPLSFGEKRRRRRNRKRPRR
jgi:hypothetical protein